MRPFVSIVMPTAGRAAMAADALESLADQDYPAERFEVLVVVNGTPDGTADVVERLGDRPDGPALRLLTTAGHDPNRARNAGLDAARGDPICLVDDDVLAPPSWLGQMVDGALRNPAADCLGGPVRPRFEAPPPRTCADHELAGTALDEGAEEREVDEVWAGNMAIRRRALELAGPLREGLVAATESEWEARLVLAGGRIVYLPRPWLWHRRGRAELSPRRQVVRSFQLGYAVVALGQRPSVGFLARGLWASGSHAARARCTRGLTDAARSLGSLCAIAAGRRRRPRSDALRYQTSEL